MVGEREEKQFRFPWDRYLAFAAECQTKIAQLQKKQRSNHRPSRVKRESARPVEMNGMNNRAGYSAAGAIESEHCFYEADIRHRPAKEKRPAIGMRCQHAKTQSGIQ